VGGASTHGLRLGVVGRAPTGLRNPSSRRTRARGRARGIAGHLKRFWDPRMRREILRWVDEHHGKGLKESARAAIDAHRDKLMGGV